MNFKHKRIAISSIIVFLFVSITTLAAIFYPDAKVVFSGIEMIKNGSTTQGFVDITLKEVDTPGLSFCLEYDQRYIMLSDYLSNEPIENPASTGMSEYSFNIKHEYFEQNLTAFHEQCFRDTPLPSLIGVNMPIIGIADADPTSTVGRLIMNFLPTEDADTRSDYIEWVEKDNNVTQTILANTKEGVKLGRLSFRIVNPAEFSKLSDEEAKNLIRIVPFSEMIAVEEPELDNAGVHISYVDDEGTIKWYSNEERNIDYEIDISAKLTDVSPDIPELTVSSYEIYKNGTTQDLLDFINEKMSKLILTYADDSQVPAMFEWTEDSVQSIMWDPLGGDYIVTQKYKNKQDNGKNSEEFPVSVTVHVTPISLLEFATENDDITYLYGSPDFPEQLEDLGLPKKTRPVLDTYLPNSGIPELDIEWYNLEGEASSITDLPADFNSGNPGTFVFIGHLSSTDENLSNKYPWLTVPENLPEIKIIRNVVTSEEDMPKTLVVNSATTSIDGTLTIEVSNSDGSAIPDGTVFDIKMPGGETINSTIYSVVIVDGSAIITMNPDISNDTEKKLAQLINLGDRAGTFAIASTEPDKNKGEYTTFAPQPRRNFYLPSGTGGDYEFDYSDALSAMFPVKAGTTLPTTVTLPISTHRIETLYDGFDGDETGFLSTFTVDSWTVTDGDISAAGSIVTVTGRLADTAYTNYGEVFNDDGYNVTIKYLVVENDAVDSIADIPDFVYDTQQVGYDYDDLQTKTFTARNTGLGDIYGLSVNIALSDVDGKEAFVLTKEIAEILKSGESTDFDITTKIGLPIGIYVSTVTLMSNNNVLDTFTLKFEVSENPVYEINITPSEQELKDNPNKYFGSAETESGTYKAEEGETVTIIAKAEEDCRFIGWTLTDVEEGEESYLSFDDPAATTTSFVMPARDVYIEAKFEEMLGAKLRTTELYVKDSDDTDDPSTGASGYTLNDENWTAVEFNPVKREYYVAVPSDKEDVRLWFKPREEAKNATIELKNEIIDKGGNKTSETVILTEEDASDSYYKSDEIELTVGPDKNLVTLSFTYDDPADDPDEGEVTRSYKLHIYRKIETSKLMTFVYGNSPYGLIMRDDSITDKDAAKQAFIDNGNTFTSGNVPAGATEGIPYLAKAWTSVNYDFDDSALFVINTEAFIDPGYKSVINSIGGEVTSVSKSIEVEVLGETTASLQNGSAYDFVYTNTENISLLNSGPITELLGKRIRPDVYHITYSFTDFDGSPVSVKKPIIILPSIGDINVSATADAEDVSRILHRFSTDIADNYNVPNYNDGGALFKFRVCDVNKDGNLNAVDANNIRANILNPFYTNLSEGGGG